MISEARLVHRQMYWCVWGGSAPVVEAAALDGAGRAALLRHKLVYPAALALDPAPRRLHWADAYLDTVESVRVTAANRTRRTRARPLPAQRIVQLGALEDVVYAPLWAQRAVHAVRASGDRRAVAALEHRPTHALVFHRQAQPIGESSRILVP